MQKNKKVVVILPTLSGGGAQWVLNKLSHELVETYEVIIVTFEDNNNKIRDKEDKLKIIYTDTKSTKNSFFILKKIIETLKPDLIISSLIQTNILLIILSKFLKFKPILVIRETNTFIQPIKYKKRVTYFFYYFIRFLYHFAPNIIAPSEGIYNEINKYLFIPKNKIKVLNSPFFNEEIIKLANKKIFINLQEKYVVAVGRLTEQKNFDFLIQSFSKISNKVDFKLIIVGNGIEKNNLKKLIINFKLQKKVIILDKISNPIPIIAKSIALVQCSRWEGLSNVLLHAISLKKLIICTNYNYGPKDIIKLGYDIKLVDNEITNFSNTLLEIEKTPKYNYDNRKILKDDIILKNNYINYLDKLINENIAHN